MVLVERWPASSTAWLYAQCRAASTLLLHGSAVGVGGSLPDTLDMRVQRGKMKNLKGIDFNKGIYRIPRNPISKLTVEAAKTKKGGWGRNVLASWGVPYPPPKGWRQAIQTYGVPLFDFAPKLAAETPIRERPKTTAFVSAISVSEKTNFYKSWEWRTLRMEVIKESDGRCQCCGAGRGDTSMSGEPVRLCVDHIKPISKHWKLRLVKSNLQVLCDECNQGKGAWDETDWRVTDAVHEQLRYTV